MLPPKAMQLPWSGLLPGDIMMSEGCAELTSTLTWVLWENWSWGPESRRADPTLDSCRTWKNGSQTSSRKHSRAGPGCMWQVRQPQRYELGRAYPTTDHPSGDMDKGEIPSSLLPAAGGRPGPGFMRAVELALTFTCCSTQESGPWTSIIE